VERERWRVVFCFCCCFVLKFEKFGFVTFSLIIYFPLKLEIVTLNIEGL
jgi:hypothetical protein